MTEETYSKNEKPEDRNVPLLMEPADFYALTQEKFEKEIDICIVDLSSEANFLSGHVPGAIHIPPQALMSGKPPAPGRLPEKERLNQLFSYLGLSPNKHFVVYDDEGGGWAGRFIWTLDVIGHKNYSYINGGITAWRQDQLPTETSSNKPQGNNANVTINRAADGPIAEIIDIKHGLEEQSVTIWDARSPQEYHGEKILAEKAGHIPGAINCEWTSLMDSNKGLRIRSDAASYLDSIGLKKNQKIITHCQSHHRSGFTYLVGKILGFDIRGYHGSWSEWGNHPDTPVEQ